MPAIAAELNRTRSFSTASRPRSKISSSVSAVACPVGNGRSARNSSDARRYHATQTPRKLTANTHMTSCIGGMLLPDIIASAGIGATRPPEMILADDDAAVCAILASPAPRWRPKRVRASNDQKPADSSNAIIEILNDQPIFRPE